MSLLLLSALLAAADEPPALALLDFGAAFDVAGVPATDLKLARAADAGGLTLTVGHQADWPGITLKAPAGHWDLSRFARLTVVVKNVGASAGTLCCRVDNPGADGVHNCNTGSLDLAPGASGTLTVEFHRRAPSLPGVKLFGMRGYPVNQNNDGTIDTAGVTQLVVFVPKPQADTAWQIAAPRAEGATVPLPSLAPDQPFMPFIDTFGQYIHRDWPGKVHSLAELQGRIAEEAADLAAHPGPAGWDQWGGWAEGPQLKATGFFRVEKVDGKWWLVDPDGRLFWSHGIDCVGEYAATPTDERESWWQDFPGNDPDLKTFWGGAWHPLHGYYAGKTVKVFSFSSANLRRKYGPDWKKVAAELAHRRLRSWGANTIGNWSDDGIKKLRRTPYVATVGFAGKMLEGSQGYWGKFRDVFDPSFAAGIAASMKKERGQTAGDPWCLGFFVDNEIAWGDDVSLATAALASPPEQVAKQVFIADLQAKYGEIAKLNAAWGTHHADWAALAASREAPDKAKAGADLHAFYTKTAETYFRVIREAVKAVAPDQLYLGCRFAWTNDLAARAAGKYCDVVSYNLYQHDIAHFHSAAGDLPLLVGEFHFGALDRGMFHTGLVPTASQAERAKAYQSYVQGALRHPQFVGTHWFEYQDEPVTGRWYDEENYQIGFIDQADTPYAETVAAARLVGADLYRYRQSGGK
jgi:hypothetical protein